MARLEWTETLSVGEEELDSQHRELFRIYNTLHESLLHGSPENTNQTKLNTLKELRQYVLHHFNSEERFMERIGFPQLITHQLRHREFSDKIKSLQAEVETDQVVLSTSLIKLLRNWIADHVASEDRLYAEYYRLSRA